MGRTKSKIRSVAVAVISALATATFAASANAAVGSVKILGNHPAEAAELVGQGSVASDRQLGMQLTLALHNRADLDRLLAAQQDPSSPQYHHWISTGSPPRSSMRVSTRPTLTFKRSRAGLRRADSPLILPAREPAQSSFTLLLLSRRKHSG